MRIFTKFSILIFIGYSFFLGFYEANAQCYVWSSWKKKDINQAYGSISLGEKEIAVTMSTNYPFDLTNQIYRFDVFNAFRGFSTIPNSTVPNTSWTEQTGVMGKTTLCFSEPITNLTLLIASLGRGGIGATKVSLNFSNPYTVLYDGGRINYIDSHSLEGEEGNTIITFPGTLSCLTIYSDINEFANINCAISSPFISIYEKGNCSVPLVANGAASYKWSGGDSPTSARNTVRESGIYSVTAVDQNGCIAVAEKQVEVPKNVLRGTVTKTICKGEAYLGYRTAGSYVDTLKTAEGCDSVRTVNLNVVEKPVPVLENSYRICEGQTAQLSPTLTHATGSSTYEWSTGDTSSQISANKSGVYSVTVSNGICSNITSTSVTVAKLPALLADATICKNEPLAAGSIENNLKYLWEPTGETTETITPIQTGTYTVRVTNVFNCSAIRTFNVLEKPVPVLEKHHLICEGESVRLRPTITPLEVNPVYKWSTGATSSEIKANSSGLFSVTVTNGICANVASTSVTVAKLPTVLPAATVCKNEPVSAGGLNDNLTYLWEPTGETTEVIKPGQAGTYTVKVTNEYNCSSIRRLEVTDCVTEVFAPDAFTPNLDQLNDTFKFIITHGIPLKLAIYNRWGDAVYADESDNPEWDGTWKGSDCPSGQYAYRFFYKSLSTGEVLERRGTISLIR
ncbi:hypothetical protein GCM10028805_03030 [Spirosoma harenae]